MPLGPNVIQLPIPPCRRCKRTDGILTFEDERRKRVYLCLDCAEALVSPILRVLITKGQ